MNLELIFKKETLAQVFFYEFCEISKNTFFTEHLWTTASVWRISMEIKITNDEYCKHDLEK